MILVYEDRTEMQRSMKKAGIREVFIRQKKDQVRVTALVSSQAIALYESQGSEGTLQVETDQWKGEHFEVLQGEVLLSPQKPDADSSEDTVSSGA